MPAAVIVTEFVLPVFECPKTGGPKNKPELLHSTTKAPAVPIEDVSMLSAAELLQSSVSNTVFKAIAPTNE